MTWPILAPMGSCGRSSSRTCVDFSVVPSGIVTVTGFVAGVIFVAVASTTRKWLEAPESSSPFLAVLLSDVINLEKAWGRCTDEWFLIIHWERSGCKMITVVVVALNWVRF